MSKLGFHVHYHSMPAEAETLLHTTLNRLDSSVSLVLNNAPKAHELKAMHPDMEVVLRLMPSWGGTDDAMHTKGHSASEHADWYEQHISDKRIICVDGNEPQPPFSDAAIQWSIDFGKACLKRGLRAALLNSSVGTLPEDEVYRLRPLIDLINANPGKLFLGLHEYTPPDWRKWFPWLMGNFRFINSYCDMEKIPRPPIFILEWGYDTRKDFNKPTGSWCIREAVTELGEQLAAQALLNAYEYIYKGVDNIKGVCFFSWHFESDDWQRFNIVAYPVFLEYLIKSWPPEDTAPPDVPDTPDTPNTPDTPDKPDNPTDPPPIDLCAVLKWLIEFFGCNCK